MPHFELAAHKREATQDPITFELRGERFTCAPSVPDWAGVELAAADEENPTEAAQALVRFILVALVPDDEDRFKELLRRKWRPARDANPDTGDPGDDGWEPIVREEFEGLVGWLAGIYTGRPSTPLSSLDGGRQNGGASLTGDSDSPATRPVRPDTDGGGS